nr:MAG TPA: hypothetical protein [Caudoviricetes sp.]
MKYKKKRGENRFIAKKLCFYLTYYSKNAIFALS